MKKWLRSFLPTLTGALLLGVCTVTTAGQDLAFNAAWIRAMPPGMKMTAGFGRLHNAGSETIELTTFSSPQFGDVSLHRTELVEGVSRMREVPSLVVAPGQSVALEPGGYHLMLMMPGGPLAEGQVVTVEMTGSDGRSFNFAVPVERR
jgi:copper(I)-binding protein